MSEEPRAAVPNDEDEASPPDEHEGEAPDDAPFEPSDDDESPAKEPVEALLGWREFQAVAPRRRSDASTQASFSAMQRWMRLSGHDTHGFYTMADWQTFYADAMASTGSVATR
jgi:hypothetical protein